MTEYVNQCGRCGSSIHYTDCIDCDGTGLRFVDAVDDEGYECEECDGDGFIAFCISSQEWCHANPLPGHENTPRNTVVGVAVGESWSLLVPAARPNPQSRPGALEWDCCNVCGKRITVKVNGTLRAHGHPARRCSGSGKYGLDWLAWLADFGVPLQRKDAQS